MNDSQLIYRLNSLFKSLHEIYEINSGGCCYVAYLVAKELDKRNLPYALRIYNDRVLPKHECFRNIEFDHDDFPIHSKTANHYVIKYCNDIINPDDDLEDAPCVDLDNIDADFIEDIYLKGDWNPTYNINNSIFVERFIKIIFDQYDAENKKFKMQVL